MRGKLNVLSGQAFGKVDWVTQDGRELGMFLKLSTRDRTRVVLRGKEVERVIGNHLVQKGQMVTAHGELSARCMQRKDDASWMSEVLLTASKVHVEKPDQEKEVRLGGSLYANLKGVILHWDPKTMQLKTFLNKTDPGRTEQVTVSMHMTPWINGMSAEKREKFMDSLKSGREFTTSACTEVDSYQPRNGERTPVLLLLPTDFRLQG